ncbi:MAG TPA: phosphotransferase [Candidatus Binataceae bacterium]|nr:phosphotransferase [Candidatus Binataceae bacterium]
MPFAPCADPEAWIAATATRLWGRDKVSAIVPLKGDASSRRFWRVNLIASATPPSAVAIDLGPDDLPLYARALRLIPEPLSEPPWLNLHRFLSRIGAAVPEIFAADHGARMLLVEDVGSTALFDAALQGDAADLYRLAADELLRFHIEGTRLLDNSCLANGVAYDRLLFRWELEQFIEAAIAEVAPGADRVALGGELDQLAVRLDRFGRVFSHRDFHGHNLFVQTSDDGAPRLRVIDFQDALMAPAAQDLAVLLTTRDAERIITPTIERRVLDYYYAALMRLNAPHLSFEDFQTSYRLCVLQHAVKMVGRFIVLDRGGKDGYRAYVPYALAQARRMLAQTEEFPVLRAALAV